ncbi:MAG: beta-galactosidase [Candidatus Doudnabacteria bacterium]|nr:beta-galactosidase [Candidatus Doudnabacteria bacterium]
MKKRILEIFVGTLVLFFLMLVFFYSQHVSAPQEEAEWGISFSHSHAEYLGFDWRTMYLDMLNDLKPKKLRLMTYWDALEPEKGVYDFQAVDEMLIEAEKQNIDVILVVGRKQPRWPECHNPAWFDGYSSEEQDQEQLKFVKVSVEHFKQFKAIKIWQVENEALFNFGEGCTNTPKLVLQQEMGIVRALDNRPIMVTDSGELGRWVPVAKTAKPDIFGTTMYRTIYNEYTGYLKYPLPPGFFKIKSGILRTLTPITDIRGVELQAEPWFKDPIEATDLETQMTLMNPKIFADNIEYAKKTGLKEHYLWGVEWWYWLAHKQGDWGMWQTAKELLVN